MTSNHPPLGVETALEQMSHKWLPVSVCSIRLCFRLKTAATSEMKWDSNPRGHVRRPHIVYPSSNRLPDPQANIVLADCVRIRLVDSSSRLS